MILLIDAGNTRIKLGWVEPGTGRRETTALALGHADLAQLTVWLRQLHGLPAVALGVNVAGAAIAGALETLLQTLSCPITWVTSQAESLGVHNGYDTPGQLGPDRWVGLLGLARRAQNQEPAGFPPEAAHPPLILANFGTATTIDTLLPSSDAGRIGFTFPGGLILPGPDLMRSSLAAGTANLPEADSGTAAYPKHTHQAIASGIGAAQAGAVVRQWMIGLEHSGQPPRVYASGGGWPAVQEETQRLLAQTQAHMKVPATSVEWLAAPVLDGLAYLAAENR